MKNQTITMFSTTIKKAVEVYVVGEIYNNGRFVRSIYYYGKNPKEVLS